MHNLGPETVTGLGRVKQLPGLNPTRAKEEAYPLRQSIRDLATIFRSKDGLERDPKQQASDALDVHLKP